MALEGATETVVDAGASNSGASGASQQTTVTAPPDKAGTPHPDHAKWDVERRGMLADLQAERKSRQEFERQFGTTKAELEREQKRVRAALGVDPVNPADADTAEIKAKFAQLYPHLGNLTADDITALRDLRENQSQVKAATDMMWRDKARVMSTAVESRIAKELGGDLTPRQIANIRGAYVRAAEENPEFLERHERGDMKLADEFAAQFVEDWIEPARRKVLQQQVNQQRRVPSGRDRSAPGGPPTKQIDVNDPKAVEDFLIAGRKERGQAFGR